MIREHRQMCSLGAGEVSMAKQYQLLARIHEAFAVLGGLQQHPMSTDPAESEEEKALRGEWEVELEVLSRDFVCFFTGSEIDIQPPKDS